MNHYYKNKYYKYKQKYEKLKYNIQHGGTYEIPDNYTMSAKRRIQSELTKLIEANYIVNVDHLNSNILLLIDKYGNQIKITIPNEYPFKNIKVYGVQLQPRLTTYIVDQLLLIDPFLENVLVYCHPRKILKQSDHYLYDSFVEICMRENLHNPILYTLDITNDPDILADGFSDDFTDRYANNPAFNIVFMPDCSGPWYKLQTQTELDFNEFYRLIDNVLKIIKPSGKLIISKFTVPTLFSTVLNHYPTASDVTGVFNASRDVTLQIIKEN